MGRIVKCLYLSRSFYHTAVSRAWPQQFRAEFQRFFQNCLPIEVSPFAAIIIINPQFPGANYEYLISPCNISNINQTDSGERPILYTFNRQPSDMFMHRGAYGLSLAGIFISFYGVYLMVQDTNTKKQSH